MTDRLALTEALLASSGYDDWVAVLARYFERHGVFFGHGTDNAADEAFWLLRHLQQWQGEVWAGPPDPALASRAADIAVRRVAQRRPLAYLLGEAWFAGLSFVVDERVLIPRSPLAEIIERGFAPWAVLGPGDRVLDVGTGSGCIAVAAAYYCPGVAVDATDVSAAALAVAAENVARHGVGRRVELLEADLFPPPPRRYRVIVSNPPYVPAGQLARLPPEYACEPAAALAAGPAGIDAAARLIEGAADYLVPGGALIVEVGEAAQALAAAYPRLPFTWLELTRGGEGVFVLTAEELAGAGLGRDSSRR